MNNPASLLAAFLSPALFYGGAGAVAAPILIHLLARRRFKRIRWAAMEFLIDAERRNRRRIRMEEWILLALRCLAVLLIALLVARPFIKPAGAALWGGARSTERVFLVDDSLSMAYETPDGSPLSRAKTAIRRVIDVVRRETPDDTVTVLRMTEPAAPIESSAFLDDEQTRELLGRIEALSPTQRAIDPVRAIEGVADVLKQNEDITNAAVYILSDFQRENWIERAGQKSETEGQGLFSPLKDWASEDRGLHVVLVNVAEDNAVNRAVTGLQIRGGKLVAGTTGLVRAEIGNFADRDVVNLEVQLSVGHAVQPSKTVRELAARQTASVDLDALFTRTGSESVRVELPPDALSADDVRYAATDVADAIHVLVVDGEPSADPYDDEVTLLTTALRPEGEVFSGVRVTTVDESKLDETSLNRFHVVVLANVYRVSEPAIESLEQFARRGGGVLFFLGDQVDADLYNTALYRDGEGLLPAELTEVKRATSPAHLVITDRLHPAIRGLSREGDPLGIGQIDFVEYFGCRVAQPADTEPDLEETAQPNAAARPTRIIARFDDAQQWPALVERSFGRGRVALITTSADKEWNAWPDHPTYLPVMIELIRHVASRGAAGQDYWVGQRISLPIDPAVYEPDVVLRTPSYPNEREINITASPASDGRGLVVAWDHSQIAGLYQFVLTRRNGGEEVRAVAVNIDPSESDLMSADEDELRTAAGDVPLDYFKGIDRIGTVAGEARIELWRACLVAAMGVLMLELGLAWWWGRRR